MPQAVKTALPVLVMDPEWSGAFNFFTGRWMSKDGAGNEAFNNAKHVCACLRSQGHVTGIYTAETSEWDRSVFKMVPSPYWRVYIRHPVEADYYTWFNPGKKDEWADPINVSDATWFEFEKK